MSGWQTLLPNSVLVTGGAGALGRAVVARLDTAEHHVRVLSCTQHRTDATPHM